MFLGRAMPVTPSPVGKVGQEEGHWLGDMTVVSAPESRRPRNSFLSILSVRGRHILVMAWTIYVGGTGLRITMLVVMGRKRSVKGHGQCLSQALALIKGDRPKGCGGKDPYLPCVVIINYGWLDQEA